MKTIWPYLTDLDEIVEHVHDGKQDYIQPKLRNLGSVSLVLVREVIAPTVFRNLDPEITDIGLTLDDGKTMKVVRAVPNKFKHKERGRGIQILRNFRAGGRFPQNRHDVNKDIPLSELFDINSLVFGDSVNQENKVLPVKAAVLYSDGLSLVGYESCTDSTFHVKTPNEYGTLFDINKGQNTNNIFDRHYIVPGTLLVQVISTHGRILPREGLDHLLMSLGYSGAYGGQTSVSGVNIKTHLAGIYASKVERPETSPFQIARHLLSSGPCEDVHQVIQAIDDYVAPSHSDSVKNAELTSYQQDLLERLCAGDEDMEAMYRKVKEKVGVLFDCWFNNQAKARQSNSKKK